ncbi:MAG TPA: BON domain-containing protein [Gemmatimonadaceae bacterium]
MADRITDFQSANYWNPPLWGPGAGQWYGRPSDIGPYYGGRGYGYGSSGTFFNSDPFAGFGGANLDFSNLEYASPYAGETPPGAGFGPPNVDLSGGYGGTYGDVGADSTDVYRRARTRPTYAGVGPRGYVRSNERIHEDIHDQLTAHPDLDASDIEVRVSDGVVTLTGTVDSRAAKRMARDIADATPGVRDVRNELTIQSAERSAPRGAFTESPSSRVAR